MFNKNTITKEELSELIQSSKTMEDAASKLNIDRRTLLRLREKFGIVHISANVNKNNEEVKQPSLIDILHRIPTNADIKWSGNFLADVPREVIFNNSLCKEDNITKTPVELDKSVFNLGDKTSEADKNLNLLKEVLVDNLPKEDKKVDIKELKEDLLISNETRTHIVIPDCQIKDGVDTSFLTWVGKYIAQVKPDRIICLGDFADMPCLYNYKKESFDSAEYKKDVKAAREAMRLLMEPILNEIKNTNWKPSLDFTVGNHEHRITKVSESDKKIGSFISLNDLEYADFGWTVHDFLKPVVLDDIAYAHYFTSTNMGAPIPSAKNLVDRKHMSCVMGHRQNWEMHRTSRPDGTGIVGLLAGSCLTPDHKVLTADLQYIPLGEVKVGQKLVSFDEVADTRKRRYKTGTVEAVKRDNAECYRVTLESGKEFKVTKDHLWLVKTGSNYTWRRTDTLRKGTCIPKFTNEWETKQCFESGWLSGIYDGEGCLYSRETTGGNVIQLSVHQKKGLVADRISSILNKWYGESVSYTACTRDVSQFRIKGGVQKVVEMLGSIRPIRLLNKFSPELMGSVNCPDSRSDKVVSIEPLGEQEIVRIAIDEKTMIVEGYPHHNCYLHDEEYLGYQGNDYSRQIWVLNNISKGAFNPVPIELRQLKKFFG